ncbi:hypothetical protein CRG98_031828 [Punica granatum]|uniref:Uncharacterized protein n=1 Tax=Punica granatum TaxID=22663 RepID=A0A2I0IUW9_PUNGR|nr:hypothetical protein CRG98_031828 [Punica granatum]
MDAYVASNRQTARLTLQSVILQTIQSLSTSSSFASTSKTLTLADLSLSSTCREVTYLSLDSVQSKIESLILKVAKSIISGDGCSFDIPSRSANQLYISELNCIVLKDKNTLCPFANVSTDRTQFDAVLDDASYMLGCTISSLNVIASKTEVVVGRLIFSDNGDMINYTRMGMGRKAIPPNIDRVGDM